jgi:hypothetical protein
MVITSYTLANRKLLVNCHPCGCISIAIVDIFLLGIFYRNQIYQKLTKMSDKILVIISTGEREKVLTALMYAKNTMKYGWLSDVKVIFFGPSENLLVSDSDVRESAKELANLSHPLACKIISDRDGISERIEQMGIEVDYVGIIIADLLQDEYTPMIW